MGKGAVAGTGAKQHVPGLAMAVVLAAVATLTSQVLARTALPRLSPVFLAIAVGFVIGARQPLAVSGATGAGLALASSSMLRLAIVLLGLRFSISDVVSVGGEVLLVITAVVATGLLAGMLLGRILGIDPALALLIGVGTAICGNSAIAAVAPVVDAREDQVSFASVVITLFGMAAMVVLPASGQLLALTEHQLGVLAGAGVHDAAQAIAAGFLSSDEAGGIATLVKLARTAYLVPVVLVLSWVRNRAADRRASRRAVPLFALGFVVAAVLRTAGDGWFGSDAGGWSAFLSLADVVAGFLLTVAMAAIGTRTRLDALRRVGRVPLVAGLVASVAVAGVAAFGVSVIA